MKISREEFDKKYSYKLQTPMMQQYLNIKFEHQDCYLLFRMGDFYELFFEDAKEVSKILSIALSKRGKIGDDEIPMCGVPHHALENYLPKILELGLKVAICDQLESPEAAKKREGYKAVVKRDVVRIITPGTVLEDSVLNSNRPNYLICITLDKKIITKNDTLNSSIKDKNNKIIEHDIYSIKNHENVKFEEGNINELESDSDYGEAKPLASICYIDITTGEFGLIKTSIKEIHSLIDRYKPSEILISDFVFSYLKKDLKDLSSKLVFQPDIFFSFSRCSSHIQRYYNIKSINALGNINQSDISAIGGILQYIKITQKDNIPQLDFPELEYLQDYMSLDASTRNSLELTSSIYGDQNASLLKVIDCTITNFGARRLYNYVLSPLKNTKRIEERQNITEFFFNHAELSKIIRDILSNIGDFERSLNKILMRRGSPVDMLVIKNSLSYTISIKEVLYQKFGIEVIPDIIKKIHGQLMFNVEILEELNSAIYANASSNMSEGGFINPSYHPKLKELNLLINNSREYINRLKDSYRKQTGIENLKISHNNILGFYVEVSTKNSSIIDTKLFHYRQSTSNSVRYSTDELDKLHNKITNAKTLASALELEIFEELCSKIDQNKSQLRKVANCLAKIDVFNSFAYLAKKKNYTKPEFSSKDEIYIKHGRHPVVEHFLEKEQKTFEKNDCIFDQNKKIILLTGPNMGGKSTYLRQNAIIALMAQIGSFVPAQECRIKTIDRIFSRIGSGDDLSSGKSTFMVEMIETASILNQATPNSLIILDEVGRGTSTHDGVSIAWAILEYIHDKRKSKTIFATHYHELIDLAHTHQKLKNYSVSIDENSEFINFTYKVNPGAVSKSYGLHVAEIAGIPRDVINRSKKILKYFEKIYHNKESEKTKQELYSVDFMHQNEEILEEVKKYKDLLNKILHYNLDETSPKKAHEILDNLQNYIKSIQ